MSETLLQQPDKDPEVLAALLAAQHAAVARAIELAGGAAVVARRFGISSQAVSQWKRCPSERVLGLEAMTAGANSAPQVSRHELRADLYPAEESRLAAA